MRRSHKPACLGIEYAAQFRDEAVAGAYRTRPPHPEEAVAFIGSFLPSGTGRVLDLGCGSGDLTLPLSRLAASIDAVDPSEALLRRAQARVDGNPSRIRWHSGHAEDFDFAGSYDLITAADSLHWMDLDVVMPRLADALHPEGHLVITGRSRQLPTALRTALAELIPLFSTNQDYVPYDTVDLVKQMGSFAEGGRREFVAPFVQRIDNFVESIHSQNGFSRDRMAPDAASEFDTRVREAAAPVADDGSLILSIVGTVVWGRPIG